jgi:hypothetical protein
MAVKPGYTSIPLWIRQKVLKWYLALPAKDRKRLQNPPPEPASKPKRKRVSKK